MSQQQETGISRRDFVRISGRFGLTSTLLAASGLGATMTASSLARAAEEEEKQRSQTTPKHTLRFGASGFNDRNLDIQKSGQLFFARDIEARTNGAIRVEFMGSNEVCNQLDCVSKTQQGIVDMFSASTQNSAGGAPYYNVLDFAYMFPSTASMFHFFYDNRSEKLFREPLRDRHKIQFLFTHCDLRGLMMGLKWADKPLVTSLEDLAGTKNRVTGTQLGRIAMQLMNLNPVPVAWEETLDGLRQGLLDGAETWMAAVAYAGMAPVVSQAVDLRFFAGTEHTAMSLPVFDKLGSDLQDQVMESAYTAQIFTQGMNEAGRTQVVGATENPQAGTVFAKNNVRVAPLSDEVRQQAEQMCSPEFNPEPWEQWRERLSSWAGGVDVYQEIHDIAREIPRDTAAVNVKPNRWWRA
ncbi:TRAP-type C4-dicarboxylate transport system, substrate-binding protein [Modicisalibacter ilicicola DSM 19980]|uniref:TRAP-type C4-dicarboxylate transport system, substrate-binding protein n=1 Tax=Modicisalibacter ilicicola DSM 19980 TaxID=1121942 RepID=A0A1M4UQ53_9GAMM|nr:TRAP transporter substrate-binding protein DctP [Halomonas ilicicola]SHE58844.1 TRAP-type C4-dicarboxylate transport system, substrate-binding protein [Halomonas ilicicola DSM 19980]